MPMKKECVAMLLAGGQGSRLYVLTEELAKPAVPFGGKYRIIDFPLSNCINSGIDTVGVLTQYQPHALNAYIGSGQPWDLDRLNGGVFILPPYMSGSGSQWYKGTANAIFQNINFIRQYDPEYVLILGGDHIYKMDYSQMIRAHRRNNADATIAVLEVPMEEASRFGIMECDANERITKFIEKPKVPKSNLASMGIYVFNWKLLEKCLIDDEQDPKSSNDFGKNIIPMMLEAQKRLFVYRFSGYWKDVGTIDSLWEANMDLLSPSSGLNLHESDMKIYARNVGSPPGFIAPSAKVSHSLITEGSDIYGEVDSSILFTNVTVEKNARVQYSIIMPGAVIEEGAQVKYAIISEDCRIKKNAKVGGVPSESKPDAWGIAVVGAGRSVGERCIVPPQQVVDEDVVVTKPKKKAEKASEKVSEKVPEKVSAKAAKAAKATEKTAAKAPAKKAPAKSKSKS